MLSSRIVKVALVVAAAAMLLALPASAPAKIDKSMGVAAGDPTSDAVILWTRATKKGKVTAQISTSKGFSKSKTKSKSKRASSSSDFTVQVEFTGLKANTQYYYRFRQGSSKSKTGKVRTLPKSSRKSAVKIGWTGDSDGFKSGGKPVFNNFEVLAKLKKDKPNLWVFLGDTIYSDGGVTCPATFPGQTVCAGKPDASGVSWPVARTLKEKWAKHKQNRGYANLRNLLGSTGVVANWDDHEVINDFSAVELNKTAEGRALLKAGLKAFRNYFPIRKYSPSSTGFYRKFRVGANAEVWVLDERSFRDPEADQGGVCDNPAGSGEPDLAPTAPQSTRNVFAAIAPALANAVPQACIDALKDPDRSMLGDTQAQKLTSSLKASKARWKLVFSGDPIQQEYALPYDRWEGFAVERKRILDAIKAGNVKNVVWLATDQHDSVLNSVNNCTLGGPVEGACPTPSKTGMFEMITGPIATNTFSKEIDGATDNPAAGGLVHAVFFTSAPPLGIGVQCSNLNAYSYALASINKSGSKLTLTSKDENGQTVTDDTQANKPCTTVLDAQ